MDYQMEEFRKEAAAAKVMEHLRPYEDSLGKGRIPSEAQRIVVDYIKEFGKSGAYQLQRQCQYRTQKYIETLDIIIERGLKIAKDPTLESRTFDQWKAEEKKEALRATIDSFRSSVLGDTRRKLDYFRYEAKVSGTFQCYVASVDRPEQERIEEGIERSFNKIFEKGSNADVCDEVKSIIEEAKEFLGKYTREKLEEIDRDSKIEAKKKEGLKDEVQQSSDSFIKLLHSLSDKVTEKRNEFSEQKNTAHQNEENPLNVSFKPKSFSRREPRLDTESLQEQLDRCLFFLKEYAVDDQTGKISPLANSFITSFLSRRLTNLVEAKEKLETGINLTDINDVVKSELIGIVKNFKE